MFFTMLKFTWKCMMGPRLYKIYRGSGQDNGYDANRLEKYCDKIITAISAFLNVAVYSSPFTMMYMLQRGLLTYEETRFMIRCMGGLSCFFALCMILRGLSRSKNPQYAEFIRTLISAETDEGQQLVLAIRRYDFDFAAWPINFSVSNRTNISRFSNPFGPSANPELPLYQRTGIQTLAYLATHTFGLRLIYPGSVSLIQHFLANALAQGRAHLIEEYDAQRSKVHTNDGNTLDTMFIDNRANTCRGKILVICCEGNSGFYEIGLMDPPAKCGYSVLGWNHPGFAESSGRPYPDQEKNAIEAVMLYAINILDFPPKTIVLYGWSIGGYTATWAAVNHRNIFGLILDGTFDDLLPLAINQMPASWSRLVREVVRSHVNLNIGEMINMYPGPLQLIRRTDDEIICLRPGQLETNCGNELLLKVLGHRHRLLQREVHEAVRRYVSLTDSQRIAVGLTDISENQRRGLRLINIYLRDFKATHCTPLPEEQFELTMEALGGMRRPRD